MSTWFLLAMILDQPRWAIVKGEWVKADVLYLKKDEEKGYMGSFTWNADSDLAVHYPKEEEAQKVRLLLLGKVMTEARIEVRRRAS